MFLQNFSSWKPVRALAAFILVLVMATACQETAQVVNKSMAANESILQSEQTQGATIGQNAPLSEEELALVKKMEGDKDIVAMNTMQKAFVFKMKIAIGYDKESFKQAIINNDNKRFLELMSFSEAEYAEFSAKFQRHLSSFKARYAADMSALENLKKRYPEQCKTCQGASSNSAAALDEQLAIIEKANVGRPDKIQTPYFGEDPYEYNCRINKPNAYAQYIQDRIIIFSIFARSFCNPLDIGSSFSVAHCLNNIFTV